MKYLAGPAKSFIRRFYAKFPANSFIYRIYASAPGYGVASPSSFPFWLGLYSSAATT